MRLSVLLLSAIGSGEAAHLYNYVKDTVSSGFGSISKSVQNVVSDSTLARALVRQAEQRLWETHPLPHEENKLSSIMVRDDHLYPDLEEAPRKLDPEKANIKILSDYGTEEIQRVAEATNRIIGKARLEGFLDLNEFVHVSTNLVDGAIVVIYKPLLYEVHLNPDELRLLYHRVAIERYGKIARFLDYTENLESKSIILAGAIEAGLLATYHAALLLRKHPLVAEFGHRRNARHQVQVLTFNSPAPFTPESVQLFAMPRLDFVDFVTDNSYEAENYVRWAYLDRVEISKGHSNNKATDETFAFQYANSMGLQNFIGKEGILTDLPKMENHKKILENLNQQFERANIGTISSYERVGEVFWSIKNHEMISCGEALKEHLKGIFRGLKEHDQLYLNSNRISGIWGIDPELIRRSSNYKDGNDLMVSYSYGDRALLGEFRLRMEEVHNDNMDLETYEHLDGVQKCVFDLIEQRPALKIISPFHKESQSINLEYMTWPFSVKKCTAVLERKDSLSSLYNISPNLFFELFTAPSVLNPESCRSSISPPVITNESAKGNTPVYWTTFTDYLNGSVEADLFSFSDPIFLFSEGNRYDKGELRRKLLAFVQLKIGINYHNAPLYDCTNPTSLWYSDSFCPKICRVLINSNFCKRVYIFDNGLKITLRGSGLTSNTGILKPNFFTDKSLSEWEGFMKLTNEYSDRAYFFFKVEAKMRRKTFIWAIFLEGESYIEFLRTLSA